MCNMQSLTYRLSIFSFWLTLCWIGVLEPWHVINKTVSNRNIIPLFFNQPQHRAKSAMRDFN